MTSLRQAAPHYTIEDYQQWPGDWELWQGVAVAMSPSPHGPHERAVSAISFQIQESLREERSSARVYTGLDWIIGADTVVRPDIMVVLDQQPDRHLEKTPAMIVEVLSPSTAEWDLQAKRALYQSQGVEHYLVADTEARSLRWFQLGTDGVYHTERAPVQDDGVLKLRLLGGVIVTIDREIAFALAAWVSVSWGRLGPLLFSEHCSRHFVA